MSTEVSTKRFGGVNANAFDGCSETAKLRKIVLPYLQGLKHGIDIGYGGDPITASAVTMDQAIEGRHYFGNVGNYPQHFQGDARDLYWFQDAVFDYVYSSHLLEDFPDPHPPLQEWLRILRTEGLLILLLPDEQRYREHCDKTGQPYNTHHQNETMGLDYMRQFVKENYPMLSIVRAEDLPNDYCFFMILKKKG